MATGTIQKNMVLLWTNNSPSSDFAQQDVNVSTVGYDLILVVAGLTKGDNITVAYYGKTGTGKASDMTTSIWVSSNTAHTYRRIFTIADNKISFNACSAVHSGSQDNSKLVPFWIYGIKA